MKNILKKILNNKKSKKIIKKKAKTVKKVIKTKKVSKVVKIKKPSKNGDKVSIIECKPYSKTKKFEVMGESK
jgi:small subunit ribosomal protein S17